MKRLFGSTLALLTLTVVSASAQVYRGDPYGRDSHRPDRGRHGNGGYGNDGYGNGGYGNGGYGNRDPYYGQNGRYSNGPYQAYGGNSGSLIARVQSDVSRAAANSYTDGHERGHFNTVQQALSDFQARSSQGRFDTGRLDAAIASLNDLAKSDQVNPRDRSILANDLAALRQFRSNPQSASYGGYGQSYPYGSSGPYDRH